MNKYITKSALFVGLFVTLVTFGLFTDVAKAEYYDSYYNVNNTYPYYQGNYNNYSSLDNYSTYPYYQGNYGYNYVGNNSTYPFYSNINNNTNLGYSNYGQSCPTGFSLGMQNGTYVCYKLLNESYNSGYGSYYNNVNTQIPGCLPGYIFSSLTGQRCDGYYNNYDYDYYLNNNEVEIRNFDAREGSDTNLEEGDNNREIMKIRFDVSDGDIELDKVLVNFEFRGNSYNEDLPWNIFEEVRLLSDGNEIESMNTDNKSDWDKEGNDSYSLTFTNLDETIRENDRANLTLLVDINSNINNGNNSIIPWDIYVPDRGIKARGENGDTIYTGDDSEIVSIEINQ